MADAFAGIPPRPFENREDQRTRAYDPSQHIGVFGLDAHTLNSGSFNEPAVRRTMALMMIKSLEQMHIAFSVVAFLDVLLNVDGQLVYVHRPMQIKGHRTPPDAAFWRQLQTLADLAATPRPMAASWPPLHIQTLAHEMSVAADRSNYSSFHLNYLSAKAKPMEAIIDSQVHRYRRAADHIDATLNALAKRHPGYWDEFRFVCRQLKAACRKGGPVSRMMDYHS